MRHKEEVGQPVQGPAGVSASVHPQEDLRGASWSNPKRGWASGLRSVGKAGAAGKGSPSHSGHLQPFRQDLALICLCARGPADPAIKGAREL